MSQATQEAAAAIVALVNSNPRSPRQEEIEAILAKAVPPDLGGDDAIVRRWEAAEAAHFAVAIRNEEASGGAHDSANDVLIAATRQLWREPVRSWADIVARAKVALYWKWPHFENGEFEKYEALVREADDLDDGPLALLIDAILTLEGSIVGVQKTPVIREAEHVGDHPSGKRIASASDVDFDPVVNPETGQPLSFDYTNEAFARAFLPSVRLAFIVMGRDRDGIAAFVRGLTADPDDPEAEVLFQLLNNWKIVQNKFEAIAHFAQAASARVMAVGMSIGERQAEEAAP